MGIEIESQGPLVGVSCDNWQLDGADDDPEAGATIVLDRHDAVRVITLLVQWLAETEPCG